MFRHLPLFPFSFYEYCLMKEVDTEGMTTKVQAFRRAAFDHYLKQGGFPELLVIGEHQNYVKNLVSNILQRDIEQRFKITYQATFEQLAHHLLNVAPLIVSSSELSVTLGVKSEHTIRNYIGYMKQAYLLLGLQKYSAKSKMRITQEKVYPIDVALMDQRDNALVGENLGWRLETIVYLQLVRTYIIAQNLPLPHQDFLPETMEEKVICYADKFFSKTHLDREKTIEKAEKSLMKFGEEGVKRFQQWERMFE